MSKHTKGPWQASVLWFNKQKGHGYAELDSGEKLMIFQGSFKNYIPEKDDKIEIHSIKKGLGGIVSPNEKYVYSASFVMRLQRN